MRNLKSTVYLLNIFFITFLLAGCGGKSVEEKMYGVWDITAFFSNEELAAISEEPLPDGIEMEMMVKGKQGYHKGGKYSAEGEFTIRIRSGDNDEIPLRFYFKDSGEWSVHDGGKELVETTNDGLFTPLNELTETVLKSSPELAAMLEPVKGETTTSRIISISDTILKVQEQESKMIFTLNRIP